MGALAVIFLVGAVVWWYARVVRQDSAMLHRIDHGLCRGCGYCLRGCTGRCPECGRPFRPHEQVPIRLER